MARDGAWVLVEEPESCGFPDGVADRDLVLCRLVDLTADVWTYLTDSAHAAGPEGRGVITQFHIQHELLQN